eukprot:TRINITY_DN60470_c0_g1_i1.p1 TRINITY_DN60470_c0_g1~~TRINITY_DN60470_c0_g1_i1.p1  ORF type:complete len:205 (-),score=35.88 TRINITY_DN60470_c0_g1_i1:130-663(-)
MVRIESLVVRSWSPNAYRSLRTARAAMRAKTPLEMMAEDMQGGMIPSQVGGVDQGVAAMQELSAFERIAEQRIQEAKKAGQFRNLPGAGKPMSDSRPDLNDENALAAKLLRNANVLPGWIEEQQAFRARLMRLEEARSRGEDVQHEEKLVVDSIRAFNRRCPPQFQQALPVFKRADG